jgi:hypothetical protein
MQMRGQKQKAEKLFRDAAAKPNGEQDSTAILCMLRHRQKEWGRAQVWLLATLYIPCFNRGFPAGPPVLLHALLFFAYSLMTGKSTPLHSLGILLS